MCLLPLACSTAAAAVAASPRLRAAVRLRLGVQVQVEEWAMHQRHHLAEVAAGWWMSEGAADLLAGCLKVGRRQGRMEVFTHFLCLAYTAVCGRRVEGHSLWGGAMETEGVGCVDLLGGS